jgi:hypothetical protein
VKKQSKKASAAHDRALESMENGTQAENLAKQKKRENLAIS